VDFFVFYIRPEDTWYIVAAGVIYLCVSVLFCSRNGPKDGVYGEYREAWHLMQAGAPALAKSARAGAPA